MISSYPPWDYGNFKKLQQLYEVLQTVNRPGVLLSIVLCDDVERYIFSAESLVPFMM